MTEDQHTNGNAGNEHTDPSEVDTQQKAAGQENPAPDTDVFPETDGSPNQDDTNEAKELKSQLTELRDKYLRLMAEFDNYKKRTLKEKVDLMKTAAQDTMAALLPVLDDFDRARKMAEAEGSTEVFSEGVQLVYHKLYQVLKTRGLEPMNTENVEFDPERHDAITEIPAPEESFKGKVMDTVEKGYLLNDKIIRYAKVVVGR